MSKRDADDLGQEESSKRRRVGDAHHAGVTEQITSARQLQQVLTFQQDAVPQIRRGIKTFKTFLEAIVYAEDRTSTAREQAILKEYLDSQSSKSDSETPCLPSLIQCWSFASSSNNDGLQSAVVSVLALLLKTISTLLDLREFGLQLCTTLLQQAQVRLLSRGLSSPKHKEHIISPCLRLLAEMTTFDGGVVARRVFAARTFTFDGKIIARNLALWKPQTEHKEGALRRPSVRSNAVRYVLAHCRYQSTSTKADLLKHGNVFRSLFEHLKYDPPELLGEILDVARTCLLADTTVHRNNKSYLLNEHNLSSIASIYRQEQRTTEVKGSSLNSQARCHEFLKYACTTPAAGALRSFAGWYPPGTDKETRDQEQDDDDLDIDLGLSSIDWYERYRGHVNVRNSTLAGFIQTLRPYANVLESELLVEIFRAAPELVADYFFKKTGFSFDPKLTATWIGYSAFLFSTVRLPVPAFFGRKGGYGFVPPPASVVIESILPEPLSQKVLTRCLNQQTDLITFFALRLLVVAFQKLQRVLICFEEAAKEQGSLWEEATSRLTSEFSQRCPRMKDVVETFRKTNKENEVQREACLRVLMLYYQLMPELALEEKFDVAMVLAEALAGPARRESPIQNGVQADTVEESVKDDERLAMLQLNHLLQIARQTPDIRWWHKPESLQFSTFTTLLKVISSSKVESQVSKDRKELLESIIAEYGILGARQSGNSTDALLASLTTNDDFAPSDALFTFLDDVFGRLTRKPIKYEDDLDAFSEGLVAGKSISLLHMALLEQWPFQTNKEGATNIAAWLGRFLETCKLFGEDPQMISKALENLRAASDEKKIQKAFRDTRFEDIQASLEHYLAAARRPSDVVTKRVSKVADTFRTDLELLAPPGEDAKHAGLHRWQNKDSQTAITSGDLSALILCLSSEYQEVRHAGFNNLLEFMSQLSRPVPEVKQPNGSADDTELAQSTTKYDNYAEGHQYYLLLGILTSTASPYISRGEPIPYLCTTYAAIVAGQILHEPLHPMYERVCRFNTRAPVWDVERMASWWVHQILYTPAPVSGSLHGHSRGTTVVVDTVDGETGNGKVTRSEHHSALLFLVNYVYSALRSEADLQILRQRGTFEPLLSMAANPYVPKDVYDTLLRVIWRTTFIEGGSTTLTTRKGLIAWLGGRLAIALESRTRQEDENRHDFASAAGLKALIQRLWDTCDKERVEAWSKGTMNELVKTAAA